MSKKSLRAFVSSCEPQKEEATPALVPKLRFPEFQGADVWKGVPLSELVGALDP
jgi:hypothetical protein